MGIFLFTEHVLLKIEKCSYFPEDKPKVIGISECRIRTGRLPLSNINIDDYTYEYTTTESSEAGTLLYIDKSVKYKSRKDLHLNKPKEIVSTFIKVIETKKKNIAIGCIYKHPKLPIKWSPSCQNFF